MFSTGVDVASAGGPSSEPAGGPWLRSERRDGAPQKLSDRDRGRGQMASCAGSLLTTLRLLLARRKDKGTEGSEASGVYHALEMEPGHSKWTVLPLVCMSTLSARPTAVSAHNSDFTEMIETYLLESLCPARGRRRAAMDRFLLQLLPPLGPSLSEGLGLRPGRWACVTWRDTGRKGRVRGAGIHG